MLKERKVILHKPFNKSELFFLNKYNIVIFDILCVIIMDAAIVLETGLNIFKNVHIFNRYTLQTFSVFFFFFLSRSPEKLFSYNYNSSMRYIMT